jgi:hypothetical protein
LRKTKRCRSWAVDRQKYWTPHAKPVHSAFGHRLTIDDLCHKNSTMGEYIGFEIEDLGIFFQYPEWWEHRVENDDTYLFWDEYVGSFRLTPTRLKKGGPNLLQLLADHTAATEGTQPKKLGRHSYLVSQRDTTGADGSHTRLHTYVGGHVSVAIICTYAYRLALLEDEFDRDAVAAALEEVEILLEGLRYGDEDE